MHKRAREHKRKALLQRQIVEFAIANHYERYPMILSLLPKKDQKIFLKALKRIHKEWYRYFFFYQKNKSLLLLRLKADTRQQVYVTRG